MATNCCQCVRSIWMKSVRFIVSDEERIRRKRRLVWGIIVLLLVDVIWVGSAELTDVRNFSLLVLLPALNNNCRVKPPGRSEFRRKMLITFKCRGKVQNRKFDIPGAPFKPPTSTPPPEEKC